MRLALIGWVAALAVGLAAPEAAGQEAARRDEATLDAATLPVSLDRIKQRMAARGDDEDRLLRRVRESVNVYARAQAVAVLQGFNVESWASPLGGRTGGAIAYGSPTHNEMMSAMMPAFWRQRASSLAGIGVGW